MRPKVLFVINSLAGGGAEHVMATLLGGSQAYAERYDCSIALLDNDDEAYALPDWLTVYRLDCGHSFLSSGFRLWRLMSTLRPDVALSFLTRANVVTALAMRRLGRPVVLSERVNTTAHLGQGRSAAFSKFLVKQTYPKADAIIAVSDGVAQTLVDDFDVRAERIVTIANPTDIVGIAQSAKEATEAFERPYVLAMGRLAPNKNFGLAIRAFAASSHVGRLVILGAGAERESLVALAAELGIADRVILPGFAKNPYAVMGGAEFFVLSSNAEGFPNALVEAMAAGLPVVSTDCASGPAEVLQATLPPGQGGPVTGRGGLLVAPNNVEAMTRAFVMMNDPNLRDTLAANGRRRVADFSIEIAVDRYWAVIESALEPR